MCPMVMFECMWITNPREVDINRRDPTCLRVGESAMAIHDSESFVLSEWSWFTIPRIAKPTFTVADACP